jgi:hypothetical protein
MNKLPKSAWLVLALALMMILYLVGPWGGLDGVGDGTAPDAGGNSMPLAEATLPENALADAQGVAEPSTQRQELSNSELATAIFEVRVSRVDQADQAPQAYRADQTGQAPQTDQVPQNDQTELLVGARVYLFRGENLLTQAKTDELGRVEFAADDQEATLIVRVPARPIHLQTVWLQPGLQSINLKAGHWLSGVARLATGEPAAEMKLVLTADHPYFDTTRMPEAAFDELGIVSTYPALRATTQADGSFSFSGIDESWSGELGFPYGLDVQSTSAGRVTPARFRIRFKAPAADVQIVLAQASHLYGKLVAETTLQPLDEVRVSSRSTPAGGSDLKFLVATTDHEGNFIIRLNPTEVGSFELHLGAKYHQGKVLLKLDSGQVPADGNLGLIEVPSLRDLVFQLRDRRDHAIEGGMASAVGLSSKPTDALGNGVLRWLPAEVEQVRFLATGFIPADILLTEPIANPLTVYLDRGNQLEIEVQPPKGMPTSQFRVQLKSDTVLIAGPAADALELMEYVEGWARPRWQSAKLPVGSVLFAQPDAEGLVAFRSLRSDLAMELEIYGITGDTVYHSERIAALGAEENRHVVVDLTNTGQLFRGQVTDQEGNPIVLATVQLGGQILAWTDGNGQFSCLVVETKPRTLILSARGYAILFLANFSVPQDGAATEFQLEPTLRVVIEVVDESGAPIPDADVNILQAEFATTTTSLGNGRFEASGLSSRLVKIRTVVAGRTYIQDLVPTQSTARVVIPLQGSLSLTLDPPPSAGDGSYTVMLSGDDSGELIVLNKEIREADGWTVEFPFIHPGLYRVRMLYDPSEKELELGRTRHQVGYTSQVQIEAGIPLAITLNTETD